MPIRFVVKLSFDPNKNTPTETDFSRFAIYKIETSAEGKTKANKCGYLTIIKAEKGNSSPVRFILYVKCPLSIDVQNDIFAQAEKLMPLLDRLWFIHNYERIAAEFERTERVLSGIKMLPPSIDDPESIYRPLGKISAKARKLIATPRPDGGHDFYYMQWREAYPDIPERLSNDMLFKVRWAYDQSHLPVPKSTQKKIAARLKELQETVERERKNYAEFLKRTKTEKS